MKKRIASLLPATIYIAAAATTLASPVDFDFNDPKGVNTIIFMLDSKLEPIMGVAGGISGTMTFDATKPEATRGIISLDTKSIHTPNGGMKNKIQTKDWLDGKTHKTIDFAIESVEEVKKSKGRYELSVIANLTCKGTTKKIKTIVSATHMPGKLSSRMGSAEGDLLVLRSNFTISRKDFKIKPDMGNDVVSDKIELRISIVGTHVKK